MPHTPFRFLDSPALLVRLRHALAEVGLSEQEVVPRQPGDDEATEPNPYRPACMRFACPWLREPVELYWHYDWWPDGTYSELERVCVVYGGVARREVDVGALLRQRLARPLAEVVIDNIVAACTEVTGKRKRASNRERGSGDSAGPVPPADRPGV
jgi:hypothetical protein